MPGQRGQCYPLPLSLSPSHAVLLLWKQTSPIGPPGADRCLPQTADSAPPGESLAPCEQRQQLKTHRRLDCRHQMPGQRGQCYPLPAVRFRLVPGRRRWGRQHRLRGRVQAQCPPRTSAQCFPLPAVRFRLVPARRQWGRQHRLRGRVQAQCPPRTPAQCFPLPAVRFHLAPAPARRRWGRQHRLRRPHQQHLAPLPQKLLPPRPPETILPPVPLRTDVTLRNDPLHPSCPLHMPLHLGRQERPRQRVRTCLARRRAPHQSTRAE